MTLHVRVLKLREGAQTPFKATEHSACFDVYACLDEQIILFPGQRALVGTGLAMEVPEGYELQIRSRSGLAFKEGIFVLNSPGTVDSDYRGEIKVVLMNLGREPFSVEHGSRIAQVMVSPVPEVRFVEVDQVSAPTTRQGGFGSTGV